MPYLRSLYESTAEVIPDVKDDTWDDIDDGSESAIPQSGLVALDPYEIELKKRVDANNAQLPFVMQPQKKKKLRTKKARGHHESRQVEFRKRSRIAMKYATCHRVV